MGGKRQRAGFGRRGLRHKRKFWVEVLIWQHDGLPRMTNAARAHPSLCLSDSSSRVTSSDLKRGSSSVRIWPLTVRLKDAAGEPTPPLARPNLAHATSELASEEVA